jgi:cardiolipin synthase (CMP-forming)
MASLFRNFARNFANELTILRLVFVPVFAILVVDRRDIAALVVLGSAAISDAADGFVARRLNQQSSLGIALDPIADKVLMTTAFLVLSFRGVLPWWLTIVVISRDVGILLTASVISLVAGYRPFRPTVLGKASTTVQVATVFTALASGLHFAMAPRVVLQVLIDLTAALAAGSGLHYLFVAQRRFGLPSSSGDSASGEAKMNTEVPKVKIRVKMK